MEPASDSVSSVTSDRTVVVAGGFEPVLSLRELADQLDVSVQALYDLRSQGRGPVGFRVGRCLRFRRSEVDAWLTRLEHEDAVRQGVEQS
jgi:excisionase family DNA binding protein